MKIKLLLAPLLIVTTIFLLIWVVYPAWSNGTNGVREQRETLRIEREKLSNLEGKDRNVETLYVDMKNNLDKYDIVKKFIPENVNEEEIIDNLNYLASAQQTSVAALVVEQPAAPVAGMSEIEASEGNVQPMDPVLGVQPVDAALQVQKVTPRDFQVNYSVVGSYENVKALFDKIQRLDRFSKVISLTVGKLKTDGGQGGDSNVLKADAVLQFSFLKKEKTLSNVNDPIFLQSKFDFRSIAKLQEARNVGGLKLELGEMGKTNPYTP
jgi:hypothetical protein